MSYQLRDHKTGDTFESVSFTVTINSFPLDLTGATLTMGVYRDNNSNLEGIKGQLVLSLDTTDGLTVTDAANGLFEIDEQEISLPAGRYYYEIIFDLADGSKKTYIWGCWTITDRLSC